MSRAQQNLLAAGVLALFLTIPLALVIAPPDAVQGEAQRLMYLHVPAAWTAFLCFAVVLAASAWHLWRAGEKSWALARSAAEVGVGLTALTLATGSVWGAMTWGTWWAWDARVSSTVAMGLVYLAFLAVGGLARSGRGRRAAALIGVAGFATVPVVHFSVWWWRTLHQPPTILDPNLDLPIEPLMALALGAAVLTTTLLAAWAISYRYTASFRGTAQSEPRATGQIPDETETEETSTPAGTPAESRG